MIKIEKDLPAPEQQTGRPRKYPFPSMEVGDSFAVPLQGDMTRRGDKAAVQVASAAAAYAREHGVRFRVRTDRVDKVVRCWRVA